jgi:hypothetical protein
MSDIVLETVERFCVVQHNVSHEMRDDPPPPKSRRAALLKCPYIDHQAREGSDGSFENSSDDDDESDLSCVSRGGSHPNGSPALYLASLGSQADALGFGSRLDSHRQPFESSFDPRLRFITSPDYAGLVCPAGHKCLPHAFKKLRYCDECVSEIIPGTLGSRCGICGYDLCSPCTIEAGAPPPSPVSQPASVLMVPHPAPVLQPATVVIVPQTPNARFSEIPSHHIPNRDRLRLKRKPPLLMTEAKLDPAPFVSPTRKSSSPPSLSQIRSLDGLPVQSYAALPVLLRLNCPVHAVSESPSSPVHTSPPPKSHRSNGSQYEDLPPVEPIPALASVTALCFDLASSPVRANTLPADRHSAASPSHAPVHASRFAYAPVNIVPFFTASGTAHSARVSALISSLPTSTLTPAETSARAALFQLFHHAGVVPYRQYDKIAQGFIFSHGVADGDDLRLLFQNLSSDISCFISAGQQSCLTRFFKSQQPITASWHDDVEAAAMTALTTLFESVGLVPAADYETIALRLMHQGVASDLTLLDSLSCSPPAFDLQALVVKPLQAGRIIRYLTRLHE